MNEDLKTRLIGAVLAGVDGRDPRPYILAMDGAEVIEVHNVLKRVDDLLKARWRLLGEPVPVDMEIL